MTVVALRSPFARAWLELRNPVRVFEAWSPPEVMAALSAADAAARAGAYVAGFIAYEAAAAFDLAVCLPRDATWPLVWFGVFPRHHVESTSEPSWSLAPPTPLQWAPNIDLDTYRAAIDRIRSLIADGDVYQLNFTFRFLARFSGDASALFRQLVAAQGGHWSAYVDTGDHAVCSASPELFFLHDGGRLTCRPMKGTLPRLPDPVEDERQRARLQASEKNRAENVMIVDLVRNDLGRLARTGTVHVPALFDVERYPAGWQMTSSVVAEAPTAGLVDIARAMFPCGSVTGAPKVRAMQVIRELEATPRGVYTGAIGVITPDGRAHFNVAIRTVAIDRRRGVAEFGVGSGVVWDSDADDEYAECAVKAAILTKSGPPFELLETLRWDLTDGFTLLSRHVDRMRRSAAYFDIAFDEQAAHLALNEAVASAHEPRRVRLLLDRTGRFTAQSAPLVPRPSPLRIGLASEPVNSSDPFLYHKTTCRVVYEEAIRGRPDVDAVVLVNERGEITEATDFNIVAELDGRAVTPPLSCGLLAGTMRAELLARGEIVEGLIGREDLRRAARLWLINSVRGRVDAMLVE